MNTDPTKTMYPPLSKYPYRIDRYGVVRDSAGTDYRIGDESPNESLCEAMNEAFKAGYELGLSMRGKDQK